MASQGMKKRLSIINSFLSILVLMILYWPPLATTTAASEYNHISHIQHQYRNNDEKNSAIYNFLQHQDLRIEEVAELLTYLYRNSKNKRDIWGTLCFRHILPHDANNDPKFMMYTKKNPNSAQNLFTNNQSLLNPEFNPNLPTKIIIHGWKSDMRLTPLVAIRTEYLKREQCNVIFVDWEKLAAEECYLHAISHSKYVGFKLAEMIKVIKAEGAVDIHVIGFSLGAHITAFAANHLTPYKLPRITGLDPAMPGFITVSKADKLVAENAEFVDVYHTNALKQGKLERCGKVDFYMNGGTTQPGCNENLNCDHHRAAEYFAESINSEVGFWGWPCAGYMKFLWGLCPPTKSSRICAGDKVDKESEGYYIVKTNAVRPFATNDI